MYVRAHTTRRPGGPLLLRPVPCALCPLLALLLPSLSLAQLEDEAGRPDLGTPVQRVEPERPESARRTVSSFDFEEFDNPRDLPFDWFRAQDDPAVRTRPGFPIYNLAQLDFTTAWRGQGSVRLPTHGGSTSLRLETGVIPVFPSADYRIAAMVRTLGLHHARARLAARFISDAGEPIGASETHSDLIRTGGDWRPVQIDLRGDYSDAAFLQIDLELLQPREFGTNTLGAHQVWPEDVDGDAWFDDVTISQLPRIEVGTTAPANVVVAPDRPELRVVVRDLTGEDLSARVRVYDIDGKVADTWERSIGAGRTVTTWTPELDRLGWYRATIEVANGQTPVGAGWCDFAWLPPVYSEPGGAGAMPLGDKDRERFGVVLSELPDEMAPHLGEMVLNAGVGAVTFPAVTRATTAENVAARLGRLKPVIDAVMERGCTVTLSVPRVPDKLVRARRLDPDDALGMVASDEEVWGPVLLPILDRYGQRIDRWQLGAIGDRRATERGGLAELVTAADTSLATLVPGPIVTIPWAPEFAPPGGVEALAVAWPLSLGAASMRALGESWGEGEVSVVFTPVDEDEYGLRAPVTQLVKHTVEYWRTMPGVYSEVSGPNSRAALLDPWRWTGGRHPQAMPRPELAAWRTLADRLAQRRVVARLETVPGTRCYVLAPDEHAPPGRGGALVVWREAGADSGTLRLFLGEGKITRIDPFGNAEPVPLIKVNDAAGPRRVHEVAVGDVPAFIEGVDVDLVRFVASFRVDPVFMPARAVEFDRTIRFDNPWNVPINGTYYVVQPGGPDTPGEAPDRSWAISPRHGSFNLAPGESAELPLSVAFTQAQQAGRTEFVFDIRLVADRDYGTIRVTAPVEIGMERVRLDLTYRPFPTPTGPDLAVEASITNVADEPIALIVEAFAPGHARIRRSVSDLPPGQQVTRRFEFENGASELVGKQVAVRVTDVDAEERLADVVTIE